MVACTIGARMREARHARDLTLESVATALGVHLTTVQKWEKGINPVTIEQAESYATALTKLSGRTVVLNAEFVDALSVPTDVCADLPAIRCLA